jgi:hypothetical protein
MNNPYQAVVDALNEAIQTYENTGSLTNSYDIKPLKEALAYTEKLRVDYDNGFSTPFDAPNYLNIFMNGETND